MGKSAGSSHTPGPPSKNGGLDSPQLQVHVGTGSAAESILSDATPYWGDLYQVTDGGGEAQPLPANVGSTPLG